MIYVADMAILMSNFDNCDNIFKTCYSKNKHHIGVVHVPSFNLSARSFSFFVHFFYTFMENLFLDHLISLDDSCQRSRAAAGNWSARTPVEYRG